MNKKWLGFFRGRKVESARLAKQIHDIENAKFRCRKAWALHDRTRWDLLDANDNVGKIWLEVSDDCMVWYLWRRYPDQARLFCKCVPKANLDVIVIERVLNAQPWTCE